MNDKERTVTVDIIGIPYKVILKDLIEVPIEEEGRDPSYYMGLTFRVDSTIQINSKMPSTSIRRTLIHELTHAYICESGLWALGDEMPTEAVCELMAAYGAEILKKAEEVVKKWQKLGLKF